MTVIDATLQSIAINLGKSELPFTGHPASPPSAAVRMALNTISPSASSGSSLTTTYPAWASPTPPIRP